MNKKLLLITIIIFTAIIIILLIMPNPSHKLNKIIVNESKWNIIKESRTESNNLILTDIKFNDYKLIIDEKNNKKSIQMEMYLFDNLSNIPDKVTVSSGKIKEKFINNEYKGIYFLDYNEENR